MLRARPAAAFALLNHILINGFFFNQGFAIAFVPFKHSVDFVPSKLSDSYVHAGSPNERVVSRRGRCRQDLLQRKNGKLGQSSIGRRARGLRRCSRSLGELCPGASAGCACRRTAAVVGALDLARCYRSLRALSSSRLFPSKTLLDFVQPRQLSNPAVLAGKANARGAELAESLPQQGRFFSQPARSGTLLARGAGGEALNLDRVVASDGNVSAVGPQAQPLAQPELTIRRAVETFIPPGARSITFSSLVSISSDSIAAPVATSAWATSTNSRRFASARSRKTLSRTRE
jgi:hypothetical protein